jgi:hypothetical protein
MNSSNPDDTGAVAQSAKNAGACKYWGMKRVETP